jgi:NADPH-dependent ferric siderophore reductase
MTTPVKRPDFELLEKTCRAFTEQLDESFDRTMNYIAALEAVVEAARRFMNDQIDVDPAWVHLEEAIAQLNKGEMR